MDGENGERSGGRTKEAKGFDQQVPGREPPAKQCLARHELASAADAAASEAQDRGETAIKVWESVTRWTVAGHPRICETNQSPPSED